MIELYPKRKHFSIKKSEKLTFGIDNSLKECIMKNMDAPKEGMSQNKERGAI